MRPHVTVLDIETSPLESYTWGLWQQNVAVNQIKTEWTILSFAAKDLGSPAVRYHDAGGRGADKVRDDMHLLELLWHELDAADIVIGQNAKRFDIKKINARLIMAGFLPYSPVRVVDTLLMAKEVAAFTSNRLEWTADKLSDGKKDDHKAFPGFELWKECLADNPKAWRAMKRYNVPDIQRCEEVYLSLRPWATGHPNLAAYNTEGEVVQCPKCASDDVEEAGSWFTQVSEYIRYRCNHCGGFSRSRYTRNSVTRRKTLLSN